MNIPNSSSHNQIIVEITQTNSLYSLQTQMNKK